jgi:hypothetical protein
VRGTIDSAGFSAPVAEPVPKPITSEWSSCTRYKKCELSQGGNVKNGLQLEQDRQLKRHWFSPTILLLREAELTGGHMLSSKQNHVGSALPRVHQQRIR